MVARKLGHYDANDPSIPRLKIEAPAGWRWRGGKRVRGVSLDQWNAAAKDQAARARRYFRDDPEGRQWAAEAVRDQWASALWWWFVEEGRLPDEREADRLIGMAIANDRLAKAAGGSILGLRRAMIERCCREMGQEAYRL